MGELIKLEGKNPYADIWPRLKANEWERKVLAILFVDPSALDDKEMIGVTADHFHHPLMREYYEVIRHVERLPMGVLPASQHDYLECHWLPLYVQHLKRAHVEHEYTRLTERAMQLMDEGEVQEANDLLTKAGKISFSSRWVSLGEGYKELFNEKSKEIDAGRVGIIKTGFSELDSKTGGFQRGQLWVCGGGVGHGKTMLATQLAVNVAKQDKTVGFFSMEMTREAILVRHSCGLADVDYVSYVNGRISHKENVAVTNEMSKLSKLKIECVEDDAITSDGMISAGAEKHFDLIIIDHLQRVRHGNSKASLNERAYEVATTAKTLARMQNNTVFLISQFSRAHTSRMDGDKKGRPTMSDFRDSGMIEAEADVILLLYRPSEYDQSKDVTESEWIIPKLRFGMTCSFGMLWMGRKGWQEPYR